MWKFGRIAKKELPVDESKLVFKCTYHSTLLSHSFLLIIITFNRYKGIRARIKNNKVRRMVYFVSIAN